MTEQKNQVTRAAPEQSNDYRVVVFGAGGVGKSSLVLRFIKGTFRESYIPTIEDTYRQVISCNKNICTLQITDTTGSHQFPAMQRLSISKGHAFILVYSVCSKQSLEELRPIWALIKELKGADIPNIPVMLVGNKCDETAELREVSQAEGQAQATTWSISFMETSAKTNHNVTELFQAAQHGEDAHRLPATGHQEAEEAEEGEEVQGHERLDTGERRCGGQRQRRGQGEVSRYVSIGWPKSQMARWHGHVTRVTLRRAEVNGDDGDRQILALGQHPWVGGCWLR
uniref:RE46661p n=1 Tax=Drosophila melanogaster TaxID=7227 RepID=Q29R39_DROME|nr:RE46661p [Drosophila melanogaster]